MASLLTTKKRLLTLYVNKLEHILNNLKGEKLEDTPLNPDLPQDVQSENIYGLEEGISVLESSMEKVEQALHQLASIGDNPELTGKEKEIEDYTANCEATLLAGFDYLLVLQARLKALRSSTPLLRSSLRESNLAAPIGQAKVKTLELPPIPIPTFGGNIWEWDSFWGIFNTNIHSQDVTEMAKFNYLLSSLKGEARDSIRKFQVTGDNYRKAIQFLHNKYGNKEVLVNALVEKLDNCSLHGRSVKDQRRLLEELQVIITQLEEKGEDVNNSWLIKKVLCKFPDSLKRKVITKKQGMATTVPFTMSVVFQLIDETLSTEELLLTFTEANHKVAVHDSVASSQKVGVKHPAKGTCMFCKGAHPSHTCNKYSTPQERSTYLRKNNLCLICASPAHNTSHCKGRRCFRCEGPHHTSCCFKGSSTQPSKPPESHGDTHRAVTSSAKRSSGRDNKGNKLTKVKSHVIVTPENNNHSIDPSNGTSGETVILQHHTVSDKAPRRHPYLPIGKVTIVDTVTQALTKVSVLLDTGAELSFIDSSLAERLQLPILETKIVQLMTFGSNDVKKTTCNRVCLKVWDAEGTPHNLQLFTHNILTRPLETPSLPDADVEFIRSLNLPIMWEQDQRRVTPSILLGCDQLWMFMTLNQPTIALPSGMYVLPTTLGYLISGTSQSQEGSVLQISHPPPENADQWMNLWAMGTIQQYEIHSEESEVSQEEKDKWERFWTLDAAGTEEFTGTEKKARAEQDARVWEQFNNTIQRRPDGYYVRLPWIEQYPFLPDNKALAYRRLVNVWTSISKTQTLLEQYDNVFRDQLRQNIIEPVEDSSSGTGGEQNAQIHYIPHQPVITPHKATTKLRVVFDASAHYKNCPSLNDVLYRGPVILPLIYGILLRFRVGKVALISDIEKAFLQVRLQEQDRDATRCFWLRDYMSPPSFNNTITFRFTRVTFGLKSSPFLLAGAILYHLNTYQTEDDLIRDIRKNMYVDNLVLTTDTLEGAIHVYRRTKQMFQEINMNLREFSSNDQHLVDAIEEKDRASETLPKVLGLYWNTNSDTIIASCHFPDTPYVTKRTITSAIASIYDPLGWILPLLYKAKVFLRELWKEQYTWDQELPQDKENEWVNIIRGVEGFEKQIPRYCAPREAEAILVTFADASSSTMAACTYLCRDTTSSLVMAKAKLPSLQVKYTIPKLELNAMTLAMRLSNSVFTELERALNIREVYVFSDSQIVLSWLKKKPEQEVGPFVYRRLIEIRDIAHHFNIRRCPIKIGYIPSQNNPADCATRGTTREELQDHLWWKGPHFLRYSPFQWPGQEEIFQYPPNDPEATIADSTEESEEILTVSTTRSNNAELLHPTQVQTWTQAKRIMAYALRFPRVLVKRINSKGYRCLTLSAITGQYQTGYLTTAEVRIAGLILLRHHQTMHITQRVICSLQQLNIHPDEQGILRCYGRLGHACLDNNTKNPIFVLHKTLLADIIIRDIHQQGHPGINHTIAMVRQQFWIPQLRSQVCAMIRKCFQCQKFNNLPYRYPAQEDLPKERVIRSYPFQHIGLDYFGPLPITSATEGHATCYGAIITCKTTRLIHIDVVTDMTTRAFLNMLRRFFARRGIPQSITSDNAPTFQLGETILKECLHAAQNDPNILRELSSKEIEWNYNTPFAPWQGGFYERLIRSIKLCLYKTINRSILSLEELTTTLTEIESLINTRPLTYVTDDPHKDLILRPIDFLQKEIHVYFPLDKALEDVENQEYRPPAELAVLQTKKQVIEALESSCKLTEKFWKAWQTEYLTALREKHTLNIGRKRGCLQYPKEGTVVLINDPVLPRHSWKMGMIHQVIANARGTVREVVIRLPSQRLIRRPINLVTPLELEEQGAEEAEPSLESQRDRPQGSAPGPSQPQYEAADQQQTATSRYNLRKRKPIDYTERDELDAYGQGSSRNIFTMSTFLHITMILLLTLTPTKAKVVAEAQPVRSMICMPGGVRLISAPRNAYEICADQYCVHVEEPRFCENISFPPEVILHEHLVQWKFTDNETVGTMEMMCPSGPFCLSISCTFCSANILNPECWPKSAILATAITLYCFITGCYVFLYVPIVLGHPIRLGGRIVWAIIKWVVRGFRTFTDRPRNFPRRRLVEIIAISALILNIELSHQCQEVNLFTHHSIICTEGVDNSCRVQLSEVFKISPFKQEACLRLWQNNTIVHEIRMRWKSLLLSCEPVTDFFTRDTVHKVIDSKRCPHSGSCTGDKCAAINASSLLPELAQGNQYPGNTACVESCGGPGCDCFFLSSGCLFYRIYLEPVNNEVFEVFHCNRWTQAAKVELTHYDGAMGKPSLTTKLLLPNIPVKWRAFTITLTNIGSPPIPLLNTQFITNRKSTALWKNNFIPPLRCTNFSNAEILACEVFEDCTCWPAETTANCQCRDLSITTWFSNIKNLLPATLPSISFRQHPQSKVTASVTSMVTSEIILSFQDTLKAEVITEDAICTVTAEELKGCYSCSKGSSAQVFCKSSRNNVQAEVVCNSAAFSIPCNITGIASILRFSFSQARNKLQCSVSCGQGSTSFEISGVLKFTASAHGVVEQWLRGESISNSDNPWPDLRHIASVFLQWYKTLVAAMAGLVITLGLTYLFLLTCGSRFLRWILHTIMKTVSTVVKVSFRGIKKIVCIKTSRHSKQN